MKSLDEAALGSRARRVLITGASGFIGQGLSRAFLEKGWEVHATTRRSGVAWQSGVRGFVIGDGLIAASWAAALHGVDLVVHCAARVHVMQEQSSNPLAEFRKVNVDETMALARQAAEAGVRRLIFLSTVGVHGGSSGVRPIRAEDKPTPHTSYAKSKYEAEAALCEWSSTSGVELVCIRPPLVYGANAPGNFRRLVALVDRGLPLPLGAVHNQRSMAALDNLVSLVLCCSEHPAAAGQAFLVSDGEDLSTTRLLRLVAKASERNLWLIPVPVSWLRAGLALIGRKSIAEQLLGTLQVDIERNREVLGWTPPLGPAQAIAAACGLRARAK